MKKLLLAALLALISGSTFAAAPAAEARGRCDLRAVSARLAHILKCQRSAASGALVIMPDASDTQAAMCIICQQEFNPESIAESGSEIRCSNPIVAHSAHIDCILAMLNHLNHLSAESWQDANRNIRCPLMDQATFFTQEIERKEISRSIKKLLIHPVVISMLITWLMSESVATFCSLSSTPFRYTHSSWEYRSWPQDSYAASILIDNAYAPYALAISRTLPFLVAVFKKQGKDFIERVGQLERRIFRAFGAGGKAVFVFSSMLLLVEMVLAGTRYNIAALVSGNLITPIMGRDFPGNPLYLTDKSSCGNAWVDLDNNHIVWIKVGTGLLYTASVVSQDEDFKSSRERAATKLQRLRTAAKSTVVRTATAVKNCFHRLYNLLEPDYVKPAELLD